MAITAGAMLLLGRVNYPTYASFGTLAGSSSAPILDAPRTSRDAAYAANLSKLGRRYSHWQLLTLPEVSRLMSAESSLAGRRRSIDREVLERERRLFRAQTDRKLRLITALSALEAFYLPAVTNMVTTPLGATYEEYQEYRGSFDPAACLAWIGWQPETIRDQAESLLHEASTFDPIRDWLPLVRQMDPAQWKQLRREALVAMDHRIAAEVLLLFFEDLVGTGRAQPLPEIPRLAPHPLRERLASGSDDLDDTLTEYGLSPHPSLVLMLEGSTEEWVIPKVMDLLGVTRRPDHIVTVNRGGQSVLEHLLLLYVAAPRLRMVLGSLWMTRPAARCLIVNDAQGSFATRASRTRQRKKLVRLLLHSMDQIQRSADSERLLGLLVSVDTWKQNAATFELAHFTDLQLARAIYAMRPASDGRSVAVIRGEIAACRRTRRDIKAVWRGWPPPAKTEAKLRLIQALWPTLEQKMRRAIASNRISDVPVARIVLKADSMAGEFRHARVWKL